MNPTTTTRAISQLAEFNQWVVWRREPSKDGKITKVPYNPNRKDSKASSTNPETWGSYEQALAAQVAYDGIGFSLWPKFVELVGIDIDNCIDEQGNLSDLAREIVTLLDSYTEISPSGRGIRIFLFGTLPPKGRKNTKLGVEMYITKRFLTVTGNHLPGSPETINHREEQAAQLHRQIFGEQKPRRQPKAPAQVENLDDIALLEMIRQSKQGPKFEALWRGDIFGYLSHSEADFALAGLLYWWSGGNEEQAKSLFGQSGLYRQKWERKDYQDRIFNKLAQGDVRSPIIQPSRSRTGFTLKPYTLSPEAQARKERIQAESKLKRQPQFTMLTFESATSPAELEKCENAAEHYTWTSDGGKGTTFFYCNDPERCALCRQRLTTKLRFYLEEIARCAYIDGDGNAAWYKPELNEAGEFVTSSPGQGIWYAKLLSKNERRSWSTRYKRHKPNGFIKPETYPVMDGEELKFVALSLAPFEDMEPLKLTNDLLERIVIGTLKGKPLAKASLLFAPPKKHLERALPRYTFELPQYLHKREIVTTISAPHTVLFTGPIKRDDIYSSFNTKAETFDDIGPILEEVALKTIDHERVRGEGDHAPDYVIQSIHIVPEAKPAYLAVYNAGRMGDQATIKKFKRADLPKLPTLKSECVDKGIYPRLYMPLTTQNLVIEDDDSPGYYARLEHLLMTGAI